MPILILTARDSDIDQVIGLEAGADDYVIKPVDPMVLLARVRALLRRGDQVQPTGTASAAITLGGLRIETSAQRSGSTASPSNSRRWSSSCCACLRVTRARW